MDPYIGMGNRGGNRWSGGIGTGIGRGLEKMTGTMLSVLMKKKQLSDTEERNKAYTKFLKAKTDLAHIQLKGEAQRLKEEQDIWRNRGTVNPEEIGLTRRVGDTTVTRRQPSATEIYRTDIRKAANGEMGWDELKGLYPDKIEEIDTLERQHMPISKSPQFKEGWGLPAFFSKKIAKLNPKTRNLIDQITSQADFDEFVEREEEARKAGIDVDAIYECFGMK